MKSWFVPLTALLSRRQTTGNGMIDYNAAPPNLSTLANNSLFETWRPRAKVLPPSKHIGDPCAVYTDPKTGLFHPSYLYSSNETSGIASATTDDLVTYKDIKPDVPLFITPGGKNDPIAVFDGSVIEQGINGTPTLFYTSVSYLPIHWTIPYIKGAETQSLAVSYDGGKNFTKVNQGPAIPGAPQGSVALNVTGFRDPYVFTNDDLDQKLGSKPGSIYAVVSGGVHDVGPSMFFYRQYDAAFRDWEYLGEFWKEPENSTWGEGVWAGRWGYNFEVANFFDSDDDLFITLGTEWGRAPVPLQKSPERNMLWAQGSVSVADGKPNFTPEMAGRLDWGKFAYAAAGKKVSNSSQPSQKSSAEDRFIIYHWVTGDDFNQIPFPVAQQGWDGSLTTPRELRKGYIHNVVNNALVSEVGSWKVHTTDSASNTVTLATLEQQVAREPLQAFQEHAQTTLTEPAHALDSSKPFSQSPSSRFYMLTTTLKFPTSARNSTTKAGFKILSSDKEETNIYYQFSNESLIVEREKSSAAAQSTEGIRQGSLNEVGKLRLFDIKDERSGEVGIEEMRVTLIVDNGVVEVFINERFALCTWIWTWYQHSNNIEYIVEGGEVHFSETKIYEGLVNAWPERGQGPPF